jgi:hypothetical protein
MYEFVRACDLVGSALKDLVGSALKDLVGNCLLLSDRSTYCSRSNVSGLGMRATDLASFHLWTSFYFLF